MTLPMTPCRAWATSPDRRPGDIDPWFPTTPGGYEATGDAHFDEAKRACRECPIVQWCGERGLGEAFGVWGGMSPLDRERLRNPKARGRGGNQRKPIAA